MGKPKIILVVSSAPAGWYLPEFAHPWDVLSPHCEIVVASPKGGETILDPVSAELFKDDSVCTEFKATKEHLWKNTEKLEDFLGKAADYDAILYIGGFGPMFDLVDNSVSIKLIREFHDASKMVSALCHGSAALLKVPLADGTLLIKGQRVTGFSGQEEIDVDRQKDMPFHLENALNTASDGFYEKAPKAWGTKVIVTANGKLLTGQNPASAHSLAVEILRVLQSAAADKSKPYFPLAGLASDGWSREDEATATCLCGAVQLAFPTQGPGLVDSFICNCADCHKITASMFASNFTVADTHLKHLRGRDNLKTFGQSRTIASGNLMTNYFCSTCGTLMYRVGLSFPGQSILRIGTVDDFSLHETKLRPKVERFTKDRVGWLPGMEGVKQFEGMH